MEPPDGRKRKSSEGAEIAKTTRARLAGDRFALTVCRDRSSIRHHARKARQNHDLCYHSDIVPI